MSENSKIETSSFNNNAIQNSMYLGKVNNHNLRKYDNNQEQIKIVKGTNDIVEDVKELYKKEFEEYMKFLSVICEREDLVGFSQHMLDVFKKN